MISHGLIGQCNSNTFVFLIFIPKTCLRRDRTEGEMVFSWFQVQMHLHLISWAWLWPGTEWTLLAVRSLCMDSTGLWVHRYNSFQSISRSVNFVFLSREAFFFDVSVLSSICLLPQPRCLLLLYLWIIDSSLAFVFCFSLCELHLLTVQRAR